MRKLTLVIGLTNDDEISVERIESPLLLDVLEEILKEDGPVFEGLTAQPVTKVTLEEYEHACQDMDLIYGFIVNARESKKGMN